MGDTSIGADTDIIKMVMRNGRDDIGPEVGIGVMGGMKEWRDREVGREDETESFRIQ